MKIADVNRALTFGRLLSPAWLGACILATIIACSTASDGPPIGGNAATGGASASAGTSTSTAGTTTSTSGGSGSAVAGAPSGGQTGNSGSSTGGIATGGGGQAAAGSGSMAGGSSGGGGMSGEGGSGPGRSNGCGKTSTVTFGNVPNGTGMGGSAKIGNRNFIVRLPDNYDKDKPYWLIFGFHWRGGSMGDVDSGGDNKYNMAHYGLQKLSKNGAIFVAPDGVGGGWADSGDMKFVDDIVKLIEDNYCVDTKHLFANGFSFGGGMSYALACDRSDVFRAVAIYDGAVLSGCKDGKKPIAYWQMHGLTDGTLGIAGARAMRDQFAMNNGCTAQSPPEPPQPPPYLVNGGHVCTDYSGCSAGHPLRWCAHQSGHGNAIVDGTDSLYNTCMNPGMTCSDNCRCTWVPDDVWKFFNAL
jgi:poly(3-hydroxybutyrate) depolymerase